MKFLLSITLLQIGFFQMSYGQYGGNVNGGNVNGANVNGVNVNGANVNGINVNGLNIPRQVWTQCRNEYPVDNSNLNRFYNGNFANRDQSFNCFTRCILERMGLIRNDDLFEESAITLLRNPQVRRCANLQGTQGLDRCEKAVQIYQCLQQLNGNGGSVFTFAEV